MNLDLEESKLNMKQLLKSGSFLVALMASIQSQALVITVNRMDFYPPGSQSPSFVDDKVKGGTGVDGKQYDGNVSSAITSTSGFISGIPFFGVDWTAREVVWFDAPGSHQWSGVSLQGAFDYKFTLQANQVAVGLSFSWSGNDDIPVLAVFECDSNKICIPVDTDGDGIPGTAMQTPPFPTQTPAFSGVSDVVVGGGGATCNVPVCEPAGTVLQGGSIDTDNDGKVALSQLISAGVPMDSSAAQMCVGGCFDFKITGVATPTVQVILSLDTPIPAAPHFRKWNGSSWVDFDTSTGDKIESAKKAGGVCPSAGYSAGLKQGNECIRLTIADNGPNDSDNTIGVVADPSGVIELEQPDPETSLSKAFGSIGGAGCTLAKDHRNPRQHLEWLLMLVFILLFGWVRRRQQ